MRILLLIFILFCTATLAPCQPCKKRYQEFLEPGAKLIDCEEQYTFERLRDGSAVIKKFFPETKTMIQYVTFVDDKFKLREGLYWESYDDGTILTKGTFINNIKEGIWIQNVNEVGNYVKDLREGVWNTYRSDSTISRTYTFFNGKREGLSFEYDSLGVVIDSTLYHDNVRVAEIDESGVFSDEILPRFGECNDKELSLEELKGCSDNNLMEFIIRKLKYPNRPRELNIEGKALIQFVVSKDGNIKNIKVLSGVNKEIKEEAIKLVSSMPKWIPGMQNGEPVDVLYTLPITFKLR